MTILWCGGEDVDFYESLSNEAGGYDSSFSRYSLRAITQRSTTFTPITSAWVHCTLYNGSLYDYTFSPLGFFDFNSQKGIYLYITTNYTNTITAHLKKYDNITLSSTPILTNGWNTLHTLDLQIINYGNNGTINLYYDGILVTSYSGDITISGVSSFNCIAVSLTYFTGHISEFIVADEDTRRMRLKTLAPSAAGDTSTNWTGAYTDIDEVTLSVTDKIYSATADADFQANLTGMPTGTYSVKAVKVAARAVDGSGSLGMALGVKTGGTVNVGATETCSGYWQTKERLMTVNPVTGVAWTPADIEALQLNIRAKAV